MKLKILFVSLAAGIILVSLPRPASAEFFLDAYLGPAFTQDGRYAGIRTDYDPGFSFGGRAGYFLDVLPFVGFALDASAYRQDGKLVGVSKFDPRVASISFDAMVRLPLGPFQPYALAGPGVYWSKVRTAFGSDRDNTWGANVGAGVKWMFMPNVGLMTEYRFSRTRPEIFGTRTSLRTHRLLAGLSFHF